MRPIDETDRHLLALLKSDARASITQLAATLGVSRITVTSRMASLRAEGVIRRFTIDVADMADQDSIHAVSLLDIHLAKADKVQRALARLPEITSMHSTNGTWSFVVRSQTRNLAAFDRFLNQLGLLDGVRNVESCLLLTQLK